MLVVCAMLTLRGLAYASIVAPEVKIVRPSHACTFVLSLRLVRVVNQGGAGSCVLTKTTEQVAGVRSKLRSSC